MAFFINWLSAPIIANGWMGLEVFEYTWTYTDKIHTSYERLRNASNFFLLFNLVNIGQLFLGSANFYFFVALIVWPVSMTELPKFAFFFYFLVYTKSITQGFKIGREIYPLSSKLKKKEFLSPFSVNLASHLEVPFTLVGLELERTNDRLGWKERNSSILKLVEA